jgi:hypothetical protein
MWRSISTAPSTASAAGSHDVAAHAQPHRDLRAPLQTPAEEEEGGAAAGAGDRAERSETRGSVNAQPSGAERRAGGP